MKLRVTKDNRHFMITNVISATCFLVAAYLLSNKFGVMGYIGSLYFRYAVSALIARYFIKVKTEKKYFLAKKNFNAGGLLTNFYNQAIILNTNTLYNI